MERKKTLHMAGIVVLIALVAACATTREVKKSPGKGGVITVHEGIFGDARSMAKQTMKENCGAKKPVVVEEGEAVIGTSTTSRSGEWSSSSDSEDKREWRITYKCSAKGKGRKSAWIDAPVDLQCHSQFAVSEDTL